MTIIAGAIGGVIVFAITPLVLRFASLSDGAMHYLKYMLLINTYYIMGSAVNTALIAGSYQVSVVYGKKHLTYPQDSAAFHW